MRGSVWWNDAQFTPRSCPSSRYFTAVSVLCGKAGASVISSWVRGSFRWVGEGSKIPLVDEPPQEASRSCLRREEPRDDPQIP